MESALVVTHSDKGLDSITGSLKAASIHDIVVRASCGDARRTLLERDFDLVFVNAPLSDESGERFSREIAGKGASQVLLLVKAEFMEEISAAWVLLLVKAEFMEEISAACEADGVLTVSKPVNKAILWSSLKLANAAWNRLKRAQAENDRLKQKIEDIRAVDRAKCLLISRLHMSEGQAHRHIEKQAMDSRATRRAVAEEILRKYGG